jgi:hypothetical protein
MLSHQIKVKLLSNIRVCEFLTFSHQKKVFTHESRFQVKKHLYVKKHFGELASNIEMSCKSCLEGNSWDPFESRGMCVKI